jgi:hypothetical protein
VAVSELVARRGRDLLVSYVDGGDAFQFEKGKLIERPDESGGDQQVA